MRRAGVLLLAMIAMAATAQVAVTDFLGTGPVAGYARAMAPRPFSFPADHGPHPDFRSEWWYFTGNLATADRRHFGFQLTFFRLALAPEATARASAWATNQSWMAHFALTDTAAGRFHAAERFGRGALEIAGAQPQPFRVWLGDWRAEGSATDDSPFPLRLQANDAGIAIDLTLVPTKPLVLQGQDGWDRKGPEPGNASYYYSFTRLAAQGQVQVGAERYAVEGGAWLDHEWSTSALGPDLAGWDWIALQLSDGSELMYYHLRRPDGTAGQFSSGALIPPTGKKVALGADQVKLEARRHWRSPRGDRRYPVAWSIGIPSRGIALMVEPMMDDQELELTVRYWEGAVRARGSSGGTPVTGQGYLELVGY